MVTATQQIAESRSNDLLSRYDVKLVPRNEITPSPENDELYGEIVWDEQMDALMDSIRKRGLEEPIILTADGYILSGHRRFYAVSNLGPGWENVPCRYRDDVVREGNPDFHKALAEYNPQRVKTVGSLLKEALLRDASADETYHAIRERRESLIAVDVDFMRVTGEKHVRAISHKKQPFLQAVQRVIKEMSEYWPLSIRQIHYHLLNNPPLTSTPKRSSKPPEHYRYRNDHRSYKALVDLLKSARYHGHVAMSVIDDPTRPQLTHRGWNSVSEFVQREISCFLDGYHRNRQADQPRHIELFVEKNTVYGMLQRVANEFYVPLTAGRGFCSIPVWRDMANRFRSSGKSSMTLITVSDYDPEGFGLADDAVRSLRDLWDIPVDGHRICVTRDQIDELQLAEDFNPAKPESTQLERFVDRTGGTQTWELEALPPAYLIEQVRAAVEANMDMKVYNRLVEQERDDAKQLWSTKQQIAGQMQF